MRTIAAVFLYICVLSLPLAAQQRISGIVLHEEGDSTQPVIGVNVFWLGTNTGAATGVDGRFELPRPEGASRLVIGHAGYIGDTLDIVSGARPLRIILEDGKSLGEVTVMGERKGVAAAPIEFRAESVSAAELKKAPCCDLSGCFSTSISVEPSVTDVITDTRELRMLGMAGVYTQLLLENTPTLFSGLNAQYGLSFIPGTLIRQMYIVKGANSVLQGYEASSGIVNVLLHESDATDAFFLNGFASASLERQVNISTSRVFGHWSTLLAGQLVQPSQAVDEDGNTFIDMPRINRTFLTNTWKYNDGEGTLLRLGAKFTDERRVGGTTGFDAARDAGSITQYGQVVDNRRAEMYATADLPLDDELMLKIHTAGASHGQNAWYGVTRYTGTQRQWYTDAGITIPMGGEHTLKAGASYKHFTLAEDIGFNANPLGKTYAGSSTLVENVPGLFTEGKLVFGDDDDLVLIGGIRADAHNTHGGFVTPRFFAKWEAGQGLTVRGVAGTGARRPLLFSENAVLLASSRDLSFPAAPALERTRNYGLSLTRIGGFAGITLTAALDVFRTEVRRQLTADYDIDPFTVHFTQRESPVISNNLVAELLADLAEGLEAKLAYTFTDAFEDRAEGRKDVLFTSRHRALFAASYDHSMSGLLFAATLEMFGPQTLPHTTAYPEAFRLPERSPWYALLNFQLTQRWEALELYAGVENLLDKRQDNPILNPVRPFDRYFETSFIWGPVKGRELFAGFRVRLAPAHEEDE
ncbi:MAG: TonB-dependent receptor [Ignavibacteriae bacterium]|nr:TonB-dependent receptor [Ignavibacteriota bacterium]